MENLDEMSVQDILAKLEWGSGTFSREALAAAVQNREAIVSGLLGFIARAKNDALAIMKEREKVFMGHVYALYLLAQFREQAAYGPIIDLFGSVPGDIIHDITGDVITEDLHRILASVCNGETSLIRSLVANRAADEYVRGAGIHSFVTMVATGMITREEAIDYFAPFHGGLERVPTHAWNSFIGATTDLNPQSYTKIL